MAVDWLAAQAAARIAGTVLDHLSVRARSRLLGSNSELAIRRAYEAAIGTFLSEISDEATDYTDALELFFRNQSVSAELAVLLEPDSLARPDAGNLRTALTASGLDLTTLTGFSLDVAVRRMTDAFIRSAAQDDGLRSILHYRLSVETRLIVEEDRPRPSASTNYGPFWNSKGIVCLQSSLMSTATRSCNSNDQNAPYL